MDDKGQAKGFNTPDEFGRRFIHGIAALIDAELKNETVLRLATFFGRPQAFELRTSGYVTDTLKSLYQAVEQFHVFHDSYSWYGASVVLRSSRAFNLSKRAFPITMARNDNSHWLPLGQEAAWARDSGSDKKADFVDTQYKMLIQRFNYSVL